MTLHVPKPLLVAVLFGLAIGVGIVGTLIAVGGDENRSNAAAPTPQPATATTPQTTTLTVTAQPRPKRLVRLSVRPIAKKTAEESITIRGRTTRGATVTVRGKRAVVRRGVYHVRLKLRLGTNRFTIIARHDGRRTRRRPMRLTRVQPVAAQPEVGCGGDPYAYRGANGTCIGPAHPPTGPAAPADCPAGEVPVGVTGACAPPDTGSVPLEPDTNGPNDRCPAGTNWVDPDGCVYGDY